MKFHVRGVKRNHSYLKVKALIDEVKKKKVSQLADTYNEVSIIKNYLDENQFNLFEILKLWDFKKNYTIVYRHLKDALSVRGFKFDPFIRDLIINLALKYIIDEGKNLKGNMDLALINYETLCLDFV